MAVNIAQVLCPKRHCISAIVYPSEEFTDEQGKQMAEVQLKDWLDRKVINPWCALCGSRVFRCEAARTKFKTMEEAMPHLQEEELKQMLTNMKLSLDKTRN
jgi:hypothetical protein